MIIKDQYKPLMKKIQFIASHQTWSSIMDIPRVCLKKAVFVQTGPIHP
jgi:hypothetical protein